MLNIGDSVEQLSHYNVNIKDAIINTRWRSLVGTILYEVGGTLKGDKIKLLYTQHEEAPSDMPTWEEVYKKEEVKESTSNANA